MKQGLWVLAALVLGVALGAWIAASGQDGLAAAGKTLTVLGSLWLDALRMTLAPLIFAVLVGAILQMAETASVGPLARRALAFFAGLIVFGALYGVLAAHGLLALWPVAGEESRALLESLHGGEAVKAAPLGFEAWLRSLLPTNIIAAAAQDAVLPLVVFACLFGLAASRLEPSRRAPLAAFFQAAGDAMIVIVRWVLVLAPIGVFGLALSLGLTTGLGSLGLLAHYVAIVTLTTIGIILISLAMGVLGAGLAPVQFLRAIAPVQVIAASTQSSLASLPAMLQAATGPLGVPARTAEFILPLAVAVFRQTSPVANLASVVYIAHLYGLDVSLAQWGAALAVAFAVSVSSVGLPGQTSFFASIAPISLAIGAPVEILALLIAVEVIPDIFRTIGNVTADLSVTAILNRWRGVET